MALRTFLVMHIIDQSSADLARSIKSSIVLGVTNKSVLGIGLIILITFHIKRGLSGSPLTVLLKTY